MPRMPMSQELLQFLARLNDAEHVPRPDNEEWASLINRISVPGTVADIDEETYWYFLEVLPPKYHCGNVFAFAEGAEPLRLFWQLGDRYCCRQLTWQETKDCCALARLELPW